MKKQDKTYEFIGKSLWFPMEKTLVIADLHIGHEEAMNKAGIFFPRMQFKEIVSDLEKIFKKTGKIKEIIVNGDLKHEFGTISEQEWQETRKIIDLLKRNSEKVVLVKGNHDNILEPIAKRSEIYIKDFYIKKINNINVCFMHGDKLFPECLGNGIKILVLGHRHPAVVISDNYKKERYKCFLVGKWRGKTVIILPSFFPLVEGSDIVNTKENNLPFIPESELKNFGVYAIGDEVYNMGKLKKIGRLN